ncbi:MAG: 3-deoxy-manno-octulosonate cytidylyltransferase [Bacteroidales bacterium]|jgi:3-deoxy-manno-octulosonate cytidylyltransferase (CMP-KDO synthetase)|nr:3-deoxy-manno-octulosonate cytidylyltransferase [Bacteroidales bacterium]MCU0409069.1 3-deoxy-manno-octulosonate cytidylyltransferase [Bacteroidales bacterium]
MHTDTKLKFAGIIPARYASSRFPGKPLADIGGKTMIERVCIQASKALGHVYVATDDDRIFDAVTSFGGKAIMTLSSHMSGTDRCAEAVEKIAEVYGYDPDVIINIQGDEPFIKPRQIEQLMNCFEDRGVGIATLIRKTAEGEDIFNPNQVKVVINTAGDAIYFSRAAIPYIRDHEKSEWTKHNTYYKHIGLYAYRREVLARLTKLGRTPLEITESLEQNRWIENGFVIRTAVTEWESIGIDTPEDLEKAKSLLND